MPRILGASNLREVDVQYHQRAPRVLECAQDALTERFVARKEPNCPVVQVHGGAVERLDDLEQPSLISNRTNTKAHVK